MNMTYYMYGVYVYSQGVRNTRPSVKQFTTMKYISFADEIRK